LLPGTAARQAKEWESKLAALERQHIADKERWRREVSARIKETRLQMAQLAGESSAAPQERPTFLRALATFAW
jgi:hypothetical protein